MDPRGLLVTKRCGRLAILGVRVIERLDRSLCPFDRQREWLLKLFFTVLLELLQVRRLQMNSLLEVTELLAVAICVLLPRILDQVDEA